MFIHTRGSAPNRSAKFRRQKRFVRKKLLAKSSQTDYSNSRDRIIIIIIIFIYFILYNINYLIQ